MVPAILEEIYENPVDIEYTVNFTVEGNYRINLLQCRPQQIRWRKDTISVPENLDESRIFFRSTGHFLGGSILTDVRWIVYVHPAGYSSLGLTDKYGIARCIGRINRQIQNRGDAPVMLIGPGRWGTTTPSLGVPVKYSEINNMSIIVEIAYMRDDLIPEVNMHPFLPDRGELHRALPYFWKRERFSILLRPDTLISWRTDPDEARYHTHQRVRCGRWMACSGYWTQSLICLTQGMTDT